VARHEALGEILRGLELRGGFRRILLEQRAFLLAGVG
jgi:hypothetical protein